MQSRRVLESVPEPAFRVTSHNSNKNHAFQRSLTQKDPFHIHLQRWKNTTQQGTSNNSYSVTSLYRRVRKKAGTLPINRRSGRQLNFGSPSNPFDLSELPPRNPFDLSNILPLNPLDLRNILSKNPLDLSNITPPNTLDSESLPPPNPYDSSYEPPLSHPDLSHGFSPNPLDMIYGFPPKPLMYIGGPPFPRITRYFTTTVKTPVIDPLNYSAILLPKPNSRRKTNISDVNVLLQSLSVNPPLVYHGDAFKYWEVLPPKRPRYFNTYNLIG